MTMKEEEKIMGTRNRPMKRAKLDAILAPYPPTTDGTSSQQFFPNHDGNIKSDSNIASCALTPWIRQIKESNPSNYEEMGEILGTLLDSRILSVHSVGDATMDGSPEVCVVDQSWMTLRRVLTLRLGYLAGFLSTTTTKAQFVEHSSLFGRFVTLAILCLRHCQERLAIIAPRNNVIIDQQQQEEETMETLRTVVGILDQLLVLVVKQHDDKSSTTTTAIVVDSHLMEDVCQNCVELFHVWLDASNSSDGNDDFTTTTYIQVRSVLEELALVLVKAATFFRTRHNGRADNILATMITKLLQRQSRHPLAGPRKTVFRISSSVLNDDDDMEALSEQEMVEDHRLNIYNIYNNNNNNNNRDELFRIQCLALVGHRRPSNLHIERLIGFIQHATKTTDDDGSADSHDSTDHDVDTSLAVQALDSLLHCTQQLTLEQLSDSFRAIQDFAIHQELLDDETTTTTLLKAFTCLERLLSRIHWRGEDDDCSFDKNDWDELFEVCSSLALEMSSFVDHKLHFRATSLLLVLLSKSTTQTMWNVSNNNRKRRVLSILSQILVVPQSCAILSRAVQLACDWIHHDVLRKEILHVHPELLESLAQVVTTYRVSAHDKSQIANAFRSILQMEHQNNCLARQSKILESLVAMACLRNPIVSSEFASMEATTRGVAMGVLLTLSENPCNRRILAKHPGLLSSMIQFVRRLPSGTNGVAPPSARNHPNRSSIIQEQQPEEMKKRILLLAKAL